MAEKTEYQAAFESGASQELKTVEIGDIEHALIPEGACIKSFENLMAAPNRIKATPSFTDIPGFADYVEEFKEEGTRIFIDDDRRRFTTVFDCHHKNQPAWGDHSASLDVELSREWKRVKAQNEQKMAAIDFAEFIEDNVAYITGPVTGIDLLAMAQSMKVKLKGDLEVEETLHAGMKKLLITDESIVKGTNSNKKEMEFPEKVELSLRVFKNGLTYPIEVFLRMRKSDRGINFWIKIPDPDAIEEAAFDQVIDQVKEATALPTLKGSFEGPSHRSRR